MVGRYSKPRPKPPNAGKGRKKGVPNKFTGVMKEAVLEVFEKIGGTKAFAEWAKTHPTDFYRIAARMIPQEMSHVTPDGEPVKFVVKIED